MAANTVPIFPLTPNFTSSIGATGNTNLTISGVTALVLAFTAGASGSRIDSITIKATGTTTAGMVRLFHYTGSGNALLLAEVSVTAATASSTVQAFSYELTPQNWTLPAGHTIYWAPHNSESFAVHVRGGDY